jgi:UDP-N-acetylglucosamine:LPS N-acetylglucosamine transferase
MEAAGAAVVIADRDAARLLPALLKELPWDANRLGAMAEASRRLGKPMATKQLADAVEDLASGKRE